MIGCMIYLTFLMLLGLLAVRVWTTTTLVANLRGSTLHRELFTRGSKNETSSS
jgi:hypothetical protein